jgi:hypothetical protein
MAENEKKRHHYIPISYLKAFADASGMIFAYRKDDPEKALHLKPDEIALERYYYSQPLPDGVRDNNTIENFFSTLETSWPSIVDGFRRREASSLKSVTAFFEFIGMMRVRVPATRDLAEGILAERVRQTGRQLENEGKLSPKPAELTEGWDQFSISIDPHMSIHAMPPLAVGFGKLLDRLGFCVVRNATARSFLTSDNPVVYFDRNSPEWPYSIPPGARIELLFPIAPDLLVIGRTEWRYQFTATGIRYYDIDDKQEVQRMNRDIARYGYRFLFANGADHEPLVRKYAAISPVLKTDIVSREGHDDLRFRAVFGTRKPKPKWIRPANQTFDMMQPE